MNSKPVFPILNKNVPSDLAERVNPYLQKYLDLWIAEAKRLGLYRVVLFGSGTSWRFREHTSDIDILVVGPEEQCFEYRSTALKDAARKYGIDFITVESEDDLYDSFRKELEGTGVVIYEK